MGPGAQSTGINGGGINGDIFMSGATILSISNGGPTGNPTGGGYFYVLNGAVHWVGSSGDDTQIAPA